jgi:hypothetical protein
MFLETFDQKAGRKGTINLGGIEIPLDDHNKSVFCIGGVNVEVGYEQSLMDGYGRDLGENADDGDNSLVGVDQKEGLTELDVTVQFRLPIVHIK